MTILNQREMALKNEAQSFEERMKLTRVDLAKNPPTTDEWETAIAQCAVQAFRRGYVLLGIAPDLKTDTAESVMNAKYREYRKHYPVPKRRARCDDWLSLIEKFENQEGQGGAYSQTFVQYRRALDRTQFG